MFRDNYKADNQKIKPKEELLNKLAQKMAEEVDNQHKLINKKSYKRPIIAFAVLAISLMLVIGIVQFVNIPQLDTKAPKLSNNYAPKGSAIMGINPNSQDNDKSFTADSSFTDKTLVNNFSVNTTDEDDGVNPEWNTLKAVAVEQAPIYQYLSVDQEETTIKVKKQFAKSLTKNVDYSYTANSNGSYSIVAQNISSSTSIITLDKCKELTKTFIDDYRSSLDLSNENIKYVINSNEKADNKSVSAFIFDKCSGSPSQIMLSYKEYIHVEFFENGNIMNLVNQKTKKEKLGEYKLIGSDSAIQYYNESKAYNLNQASPTTPFDDNNIIKIEYIADINQSILQPVYIINRKNAVSTENMNIVPAINGEVITNNNLTNINTNEIK